MKELLFTVVIAALLFSCDRTERNCENFKTGKFSYTARIGEVEKTTVFIRNDSIEIDFFEGKSDTSSIQWINNCEYIAKKLRPKSMAEKKALHFKILTTSSDSYTFEFSVVGKSNKQKGTATKIQ